MMRTRIMLVSISVFLTTMRCGGPQHDVVIRNSGQYEINEAHVEYADTAINAGVIIPHSELKVLSVRRMLPKEATVSWTDAHGVKQRETVTVKFPQGFKGVLVFEIDDANRVKVVTEAAPHYPL